MRQCLDAFVANSSYSTSIFDESSNFGIEPVQVIEFVDGDEYHLGRSSANKIRQIPWDPFRFLGKPTDRCRIARGARALKHGSPNGVCACLTDVYGRYRWECANGHWHAVLMDRAIPTSYSAKSRTTPKDETYERAAVAGRNANYEPWRNEQAWRAPIRGALIPTHACCTAFTDVGRASLRLPLRATSFASPRTSLRWRICPTGLDPDPRMAERSTAASRHF